MNPCTTSPSSPRGHAVVLGGGLTGMLAAAALAPVAEYVTIVERHQLPDGPLPRRGLPQARHAHLLWSGGALAIEQLLPGIQEDWTAAGVRKLVMPRDLVSYTSQGWYRRFDGSGFIFAASRDLLDAVVRNRVLSLPNVHLRESTEVAGLSGSAERLTGVCVTSAAYGLEELKADFVVDASGRGSRTPQWLAELGVPTVPQLSMDSGLVYASRLYEATVDLASFPLVNVQSDPSEPRPGQTATLIPVERSRWLVTLSGTRGGEPTRDPDEFVAFARGVRHPIVGDLIEHARPVDSRIHLTRSTASTRHLYESARLPERLVVLGDAVATYNPVFGHGMSVAAQGALALGELASRKGLSAPRLARSAQRAIGRPVGLAWDLATGQDIRYPGAIGPKPKKSAHLIASYVDRMMRTSTSRPRVAERLFSVMGLAGKPTELLHPSVLTAVARGPRLRPLLHPPLTASERSTAPKPAGATA